MITSVGVSVVGGTFLLLGVGMTALTSWFSERRRLKADRARMEFEADRALDAEVRQAVANFISAAEVLRTAVLNAADSMSWDLSVPAEGTKFLLGRFKALRHPVKGNRLTLSGAKAKSLEAKSLFEKTYYDLILIASSSLVAAAELFMLRNQTVITASNADRPAAEAACYKAQGALVEATRAVVHVAPEPKILPIPLVRPPDLD